MEGIKQAKLEYQIEEDDIFGEKDDLRATTTTENFRGTLAEMCANKENELPSNLLSQKDSEMKLMSVI